MVRPVNHFNRRDNAEKVREGLDKLINLAFDSPCNPVGRVSRAFAPFPVDLVDAGDRYELSAELPGFKKEGIKVSYEDEGILKIRAEREAREDEVRYILRECHDGSFERSFEVDGIKKDEVTVSYDAGVLRIIMPKAAEDEGQTVFDID